MDVLLLIRLTLAAVFAIAGVAKLRDRAGTAQALLAFGAPRSIARLGVGLAALELAVAVALVLPSSARAGAIGAFSLLVLFSGAIALNLLRGRAPDCACFGQIHSAPIGARTLLRNVILAALAGVVIARSGQSNVITLGDASALSTVEVLLVGNIVLSIVTLTLGAWLILNLLRQHGRLLIRIEALEARGPQALGRHADAPWSTPSPSGGLPVGSRAPDFALPDGAGRTTRLGDLLGRARPVMLVFTDPGCGPCSALMPEITACHRRYRDRLTVAVITRGSRDGLGDDMHVGLQSEREIADAYGARGTPCAVLVDPDGRVATPAAAGAVAIRALVDRTVSADPEALESGADLVAPLVLEDLDGEPVPLTAACVGVTLLVFWDPACRFCRAMLADLKAWETTSAADGPSLLVISRGSAEANRAQGLRARILLDRDGSAMRAFDAGGTPTAVLLDEQARVASPVVAGSAAVLELARASHGTRTVAGQAP